MKQVQVKIQIFNPNIKETVSVSIFESLEEALVALGESAVVDIVNASLMARTRAEWREKTIKRLQRTK